MPPVTLSQALSAVSAPTKHVSKHSLISPAVFLIVSECSLFSGYFARNWPLLSPIHGFVSLGCAMMVLGLNMLGNMNKEATSQKSLGLPFWRLLVASGILAIVIGFFNVVASYVFRDRSRHITARRVRSHGAITLSEAGSDIESTYPKTLSVKTHHTGGSSFRTATPPMRMGTPPIDMGSPQAPYPVSPSKNEEAPSRFNFSPARTLRNARQSILPSYHSSTPLKSPLKVFSHSRSSSTYSRATNGEPFKKGWWKAKRPESEVPDVPLQISAPLNVNPNFAHLVKPNIAHHPSQRRAENDEGLKAFDFK
jgi:hypothetical protein